MIGKREHDGLLEDMREARGEPFGVVGILLRARPLLNTNHAVRISDHAEVGAQPNPGELQQPGHGFLNAAVQFMSTAIPGGTASGT